MLSHTIQLSEKVYARLLKQAARLQTTPEEVIERFLAHDLVLPHDDVEQALPGVDQPEPTAEALAAVQRLTTLFTDLRLHEREAILDDPMLTFEYRMLLDQAL